ncbi:MAG: hypothetical protein IT210_03795 [Armatimonadetes bacterium]|nr:hypothetical protein [Armatimonadota bacterium]
MRSDDASPNVVLAVVAGLEILIMLAVLSVLLPRFAAVYQQIGGAQAWWYPLAFFLKRFLGLTWVLGLAAVGALILRASQDESEWMRHGLQLFCFLLGLLIPLTIFALFQPMVGSIHELGNFEQDM